MNLLSKMLTGLINVTSLDSLISNIMLLWASTLYHYAENAYFANVSQLINRVQRKTLTIPYIFKTAFRSLEKQFKLNLILYNNSHCFLDRKYKIKYPSHRLM